MEEQKPYVYQPYPRQKFHRRTGKTVVVSDADAETALGEGWRDSPNDPFGFLLFLDRMLHAESLTTTIALKLRTARAEEHRAVGIGAFDCGEFRAIVQREVRVAGGAGFGLYGLYIRKSIFIPVAGGRQTGVSGQLCGGVK